MYIGHYKAVNSNLEFYSIPKDSISLPTQTVHEGQRYLLQYTYTVPSESMYKRIVERAKELGIPRDIPVD